MRERRTGGRRQHAGGHDRHHRGQVDVARRPLRQVRLAQSGENEPGGAGGAFISIPYFGRHNVKIHSAVATAAALGLPIAVAGTAGFILAGLRQPDLPQWSAGYVYLPAMVAIVAASVLSAPAGAALAHRWPAAKLRRASPALLYLLGGYMLWKAIRG